MVYDPLSLDLRSLFHTSDMFDSPSDWRHEGFKIIRDSEKKLVVAKHKAADGYLFKKYMNHMSSKEQLERYTRRIEGARKLETLFSEIGAQHLVVPKKWMYELPFSQRSPSHLVIVQEFQVFDDRRDGDNESEYRHHHITLDVLRELTVVWFRCKGLDFTAMNAPFTKRGQIAFIDTGYVAWQERGDLSKVKSEYMKNADRYLSGSRLRFAKDRWRELSDNR